MTTAIEKERNQEKFKSFTTQINNSAGQLQLVRDGLTNDIRNLIGSADSRSDARMMLRELSGTIEEINNRASRLNGYIEDLESMRDKISQIIPEELKG